MAIVRLVLFHRVWFHTVWNKSVVLDIFGGYLGLCFGQCVEVQGLVIGYLALILGERKLSKSVCIEKCLG